MSLPSLRQTGPYLRAFLVAVLLGLFTRTFVVQIFEVGSNSMEGALLPGDHVLVNRLIFAGPRYGLPLPLRSPRRGDVLLLRSPEAPFPSLAKRCLGLPGERVAVRRHRAWIDGQPLQEGAYARVPEEPGGRAVEVSQSTRVPSGHYFLLGDHRAASRDSRSFGTVPVSRLRGRIFLVLWSEEMDSQEATRSSRWDTLSGPRNFVRSIFKGRPNRWLRPVR